MEGNLKVAVLMSTYNGGRYLREQIDSILQQKGDFNLDLWVRDDGSTDETRKILDEYCKQGKLHWYSDQNLGPALSFLNLIQTVKDYDIYAFADQDDYWLTDKVDRAVTQLKAVDCPALYFANAEMVDSKLDSLGRNVYKLSPALDFKTLTCAGGLLGCTMAFNAKLASYIQDFQLPKKLVMHDFYLAELCLALDGSIIYDSQAVMKYRQHGDNVVGVSYGLLATIKDRLHEIRTPNKVGIDVQAYYLAKIYKKDISSQKLMWLQKIANYKQKAFSRIRLALSPSVHYVNRNQSLKLRLAILKGNR